MNEQSPNAVRNVVIVGAGPAGLMAAIAAAEDGGKVLVLDRMSKAGAKLLATGGGRCNITNTLATDDFMAAFGRQGRFMQPALAAMDAQTLRDFFDHLGVPTCCEDGFHVFPTCQSAAAVQKALLQRCQQLGVQIALRQRVQELWIDNGRLRGVVAKGPEVPGEARRIEAASVILAAGGKSWAQLGSDGSGFELAAAAGHRIVPPLPGLAPLVTAETWPTRCAGVTLPAVRIYIDLPRQPKAGITGDLLFTHSGISGPAALDLSLDVAALLAKHRTVPVRLDLCPAISAGAGGWSATLDRWGHEQGAKMIRIMIAQRIPASIAEVVCHEAHVPPIARCAQLARPQRDALAEKLTALPLTIKATEGFDHSMVTRGGVDLRQVDPHTLASRLVRGLYFAGEVLDLAGPCGGYNLQWAFSSGRLAGQNAAAFMVR